MYIDKYSNKVEFLYNTINNYRKNFDFYENSKEYIHFKVQEFIEVITEQYNPLINVYINSNIVEYNTIKIMFDAINDYTTILSNKLSYIDSSYNDMQCTYSNILLPLLAETSNKMNTQTEENDGNVIERFKNPNNIDGYSVTFKNKCLELVHDTALYGNSGHEIEITDSNGLPGDFRRASSVNNNVIFNGETLITSNIKNILGEKEYFEYELFNIDTETYKKIDGKGVYYDEGISYISKDNKLYITFTIKLTGYKEINGFSFNDCQVDSDYIIRNVMIKNSIGVKYSVAKDIVSSGTNIFHFNLDTVDSIEITIEQYDSNECYIGHMYDSNITCNGSLYNEKYNDVSIGSSTNLGITVSNGKIVHPSTKNTNYNKSSIVNGLYNNNLSRQLILAKRYNISIYNFKLQNKIYRKSGYTVLHYEFDTAIKSFSFNADEYIPKGTSETYIRYSVSFDNSNWYSISPIYRTSVDECNMISINDVITSSNLNIKSIFTSSDTKDVYLKIELGTSNTSVSPIVKTLYIDAGTE